MEVINVNELPAFVSSVAAYGGQIASVFHNYAFIAKTIPRDFLDVNNLLDASAASLKQLLTLLAPSDTEPREADIFNEEGLKYVKLLIVEVATVLTKFEPAVAEACLDRHERKKLQRQKWRMGTKNNSTILDPSTLKIDEKKFLEKAETTDWYLVIDDLSQHVSRLYELQLLVLLVFQVGTVAKLSKDVSSGKVDVQGIVRCNERIIRTAKLVGIKERVEKSRRNNRYETRRSSFSTSVTCDSDTDFSESSFSSLDSRPRRKSRKVKYTPCAPPPPPPLRVGPAPPPSPSPPPPPPPPPPTLQTSPAPPPCVIEPANPPAYSEAGKGSTTIATSPMAASPLNLKQEQQLDHKEKVGQEELKAEKQAPVEPKTPDTHILAAKFNTFGSRFKSFFRSKESLVEEMRRTMSDAQSQLTAFVFQRHIIMPVPHSALHSLESTHLKTILAHNAWYETYKTLDAPERTTLHNLLQTLLPFSPVNTRKRELVSLKVLQGNKANRWLHLCADLLRGSTVSPRGPLPVALGRSILVICRENLVDGKPIQDIYALGPPLQQPPPPRPVGASAPLPQQPPPPRPVGASAPLPQQPPPLRPLGGSNPQPPLLSPGVIEIAPLPVKKMKHRHFSHYYDSESSCSNNSSFGGVRRNMRRMQKRKSLPRKAYYSSDSETDEEDDTVKLKLDLKKGDSVVEKLLDMWTCAGDVKGKGKVS